MHVSAHAVSWYMYHYILNTCSTSDIITFDAKGPFNMD